jgi:hypothetical protein
MKICAYVRKKLIESRKTDASINKGNAQEVPLLTCNKITWLLVTLRMTFVAKRIVFDKPASAVFWGIVEAHFCGLFL